MPERRVVAKRRKAFSMLVLLLVLCIIGLLAARQVSDFLERDRTGVSEIRRAGATACQVNRNVLSTTINIWRMSHPNTPLTIENMRRTGQSIPSCPEGGVYTIGPDSTVYCSIHFPHPRPPGAPAPALPGPTATPTLPPLPIGKRAPASGAP